MNVRNLIQIDSDVTLGLSVFLWVWLHSRSSSLVTNRSLMAPVHLRSGVLACVLCCSKMLEVYLSGTGVGALL